VRRRAAVPDVENAMIVMREDEKMPVGRTINDRPRRQVSQGLIRI
jgi:hypothetical protein